MRGSGQKKSPSGLGSKRAGTKKVVAPSITPRPSASSDNSATLTEKFVQLPKRFLRRCDIGAPAKLVWGVIVDRIGKNEVSWPGYGRIAQDTGLHRDTVKRSIAELIAARVLLKISRAPGLSNEYAIPDPTTECSEHPAQRAPGATSPEGGGNEHSDPVQRALIENYTHELYPVNETNERSADKKPSKFSKAECESVYQAYPRKVGKAAAVKAIGKALQVLAKRGTPEPATWLLNRVEVYAGSPAGQQGKYTPHPATWFNQERYDDDDREWTNASGDDRSSREFPEPPKTARRL